MGKYAFVKIVSSPSHGGFRYYPDISMDPSTPNGVHWERFGSNKFGWDLVYLYYPDLSTSISGDIHVIDAQILGMTVGEIPAAKRQAMNTWLTNKGYDTSWITLATTIKEVLKDILHYLNDRFGNKEDVIKFVRRLPD